MEDNTNYYTKNQHQVQANTNNNNNNPSKFYSHFLYKAVIVTIFLVIVPLFPSQAPEFINQTLNTRGWEFLHLIFVGIAVSYGLFSRRNNDGTEKDSSNSNSSKFDNAQSYVSRFLQVSSVFDDDSDAPSKSDGSTSVQTWNNQYYRNEPVVVVAEEQQHSHSVVDQEQRGSVSRISEKPLLLPVRSLKSRILDSDGKESSKDSSASISRSNSNLGSKRYSGKSGLVHQDLAESTEEDNIVLPSPIPWRSRSGRMEMKETKEEIDSPPLYTLPSSMEESKFNGSFSFRSQMSRSSQTDSTNSSRKLSPSPSMSSPKKFSPSSSFSAEAQGKSAEDFVRKKSFYRSPPPPPPPPPHPKLTRKSRSMKPSSDKIGNEDLLQKDLKRSFTSEPKEMNWVGNFSLPRSVRTTRSKEYDDDSIKDSKPMTVGFDQVSFKNKTQNRDRVTFMPQPTYMEYPKEEKEEYVDKLVLESDEELEETEDDFDADDSDIAESSFALKNSASVSSKNEEQTNSGNASDGGPDVDKKADEFIAKFREQIRLQRIESIKKSSGQINRKGSR